MCRLFRAVGVIMVAASLTLAGRAPAATIHATILHFGDAYDIVPALGRGGWAEAATLIQAQRAREINTIVTYGGDLISPSFMSSLTQGSQMIALLNEVRVDYAALGSHDFDFGPEILAQRIAESKFVWLASNVRDANGKPFAGVPPVAIRRIGPVTFGFFAILSPDTATESSPGPDVHFLPPKRIAEEAVKTLRGAGVDVVIALTHQPLAADKAMVQAVPGIDLVLGGGEKGPVDLEQNGVPILRSGINAESLVAVDLTVDKQPGGKTDLSISYGVIPTLGAKPNLKIAALIGGYLMQVDQQLRVPVATLDSELDSRLATVRAGESSMGDLIADALLAASGADLAMVNGGGIRGDRLYAAGTALSERDIRRELPFDNRLATLEVSGATILAALENGVSQVAAEAGRFPQVAALSFSFDPGKPPGKRVSMVSVGGVPLDPGKLYKLATNDYLARGGDGYGMLSNAKRLTLAGDGRPLTEIVLEYLKGRGQIAIAPGGRIHRID